MTQKTWTTGYSRWPCPEGHGPIPGSARRFLFALSSSFLGIQSSQNLNGHETGHPQPSSNIERLANLWGWEVSFNPNAQEYTVYHQTEPIFDTHTHTYFHNWMLLQFRDSNWLVVGPPLWKIWVRQLGWWNSQYFWENRIDGNQTTNQLYNFIKSYSHFLVIFTYHLRLHS